MSLSIRSEEKFIVFSLKDMEYAIEVEYVQSIEKMLPITRVPGTEDFIKGVINLRGVVTPVIDLRKKLGLGEYENKASTRIIIVNYSEKSVGFIVDAANDVVDVFEENIEPQPDVVGSVKYDFIKGVAKMDKRLLMILKLEEILN